ncbi:MAG: hypothetical protein ABSH44_05095 [Bryobacteraceae bacterium]
MRIRSVAVCLLCSVAVVGAQPFSASLFDQFEWRLIGPFRAGRVIAVAGVPGDPSTFYFGAVGGGVWKTTDAGTVWTPIFDRQRIASIGAMAVAPSNPNVVYVGTGETDIRSDLGIGDGVYKSVDGGKTWKNIGLRDSRQIGCIRVDPRNPDTVYVAALGHGYGPNAERGVFRSTDGGNAWQKVLDQGPEIGAVDLAFEPENSRVIYATVWNAHRPPWSVYGPLEGPGSGLYKSTDAGDHWTQLAGHGLPEGDWGRSGVATAAGGRVYALIDAQSGGGMFRSDDAGQTWTRASADARIVSRAWYFGGVTVDPKNPDVVYVPNVALYRSTDGGKTFTVLKGAPGGDDYHILWIDPSEPRRMVLGSDQGTNISVDGGKTWSTWYNQATAQFYHVITDNRFPYFVYGSQQDSGTAAVASRTDHGQIDARDWFSVGGAESGYIAIDQKDPDIFYVGNTNGSLTRFDRRTGQGQNITPWPVRGGFGPNANVSQQKYRFPWTAPLVTSSIEPDTLYYGAQYLLKTTDGGLTWHEISPDLTGDTRKERPAAPGPVTPDNAKALGYGVIYSIAPSPLKAGMIWTGSDTGLIHLTRDGGKTWENVTPQGLPEWSNVTHIEASHFDPAEAYAAVDRHQMDDYKPYVYRTRDYGKTWALAAEGLEEPAYLNAIREDPARRGLLFAATELGVYASFDDGSHWQSLQLNLPASSVRDLVIHGDDLVVATHGRAFWILDNFSPLRQINAQVASAEAWLYQPATAIRVNPQSFSGTPFPPEEPKAKNPPEGAMLDYFFKSAPEGEVVLEILDNQNQAIRRYSSKDRAEAPRRPGAVADIWIAPPPRLTARAGMNRFVWDLRHAPPGADGGAQGAEGEFGRPAQGPQVLPGAYTVRLTVAGRSYTQPLKVALDPRSAATPADLAEQLELGLSITRAMGRAADAMREVRALRIELTLRRQAAEHAMNSALASRIAALDAEAARILGGGGPRGRPGGGTASLSTASSELSAALGVAESADRTPPATAYQIFDQASRELEAQLAAWKSLRETKLSDLNRELEQNRVPIIELGAQ